jgi:hypothetical protein
MTAWRMQTARSTKEDAMLTPGIDEAIRKLDGEFMDAVNTGNAAALVSALYANNAVLMPPNQPRGGGYGGDREVLAWSTRQRRRRARRRLLAPHGPPGPGQRAVGTEP